jgi:drug/metabolite transporter (DMT)-like permease
MLEPGLSSRASRGLSSVVFGACLLGFAAVFVKWGMAGGATPLTVGLYRMLFALPGVFWLVQRRGGPGWGIGAGWGLFAGVAFAADLSLWHRSMQHTSAANSTFIVCGLAPIWVALLSVARHHTRYRWTGWLGQTLGVSGAMVLALARGARVGSGLGEILAVIASLCYATFSLAISRSRRRISARQALFWMSLASLFCFMVQETIEREPLTGYSPRAWLGLVGLALVVQLLAWLLINEGLGHIKIALGALALGLQQVATPFLAAWLLGEPLRPLGLFGGALIVTGIYLVATGERSAKTPPLPTSFQAAGQGT